MKTTKEMIEVMQAYERGEQIECINALGEWKEDKPVWDWFHFDYRVKKKVYVPFESAEEFLEAQRVHGEVVEDKESGEKMYAFVNNNYTLISSIHFSNFWPIGCLETIFRYYQFTDGTPCGKEKGYEKNIYQPAD